MHEIYRSGAPKSKSVKTGNTSKSKASASKTTTHASPVEEDNQVLAPDNTRCVDDYSEVLRTEAPTTGHFRAFAPKPTAVSFETQIKTEQVVLLLRQHPAVLFKPAMLVVLGLFVPALINLTPFLHFLPPHFYFAFTLGWYLAMAGIALQIFLFWFFNVFLVTDERIIDVDFYSVIQKNISSARIENIEDVTVSAIGAFASIFDYGTVLIQTSAERTEFEFENVPHPAKVSAIINELMIEEEREKIEGRVS